MTEVAGTHTVPARAGALWTVLCDPVRLGAALPGVGPVDVRDETHLRAHVAPSTGLGVTPLELALEIVERDDARRRVRLLGVGTAAEYELAVDASLIVDDGDPNATVTWEADVRAFGVLASVTQRVLPMLLRDQLTSVLDAAAASARA